MSKYRTYTNELAFQINHSIDKLTFDIFTYYINVSCYSSKYAILLDEICVHMKDTFKVCDCST